MPKATRKRVLGRGRIEVSENAGSANVPAAVRVSASAPGGGSYVSPAGIGGMSAALATLSGSFRELMRQQEKMADRAYAEAQKMESRAYAEAKEAERRAEEMADLAEQRVASTGYQEVYNEALQAHAEGRLTEPGVMNGFSDRIMEIADSAQSPRVAAYITTRLSAFQDHFTPAFVNENERKRQENLQSDFSNALTPVLEGASGMDDNDFLAALNPAQEQYIGGGGSKVAADQLAREMMQAYAGSREGTPEGDAMRDRLDRFQSDRRLATSNAAAYLRFQEWREKYDDGAEIRGNRAHTQAREAEKEGFEKNYSELNNRWVVMSLEEKEREINRLRGDTEAAEGLFGDRYGEVIRSLQNDVRQLTAIEREEDTQRSAERSREHIQQMHNDPAYRISEAFDDPLLTQNDKNALNFEYRRMSSNDEQQHEAFATAVMNRVNAEAPKRLGWNEEGVTKKRQDDGTLLVEFDDQLQARIKQLSRTASLETLYHGDPRDEAAHAASARMRSQKVGSVAEEILSGEFLNGFKRTPEPERLKTNYEKVKEEYFTNPNPEAGAADRVTYVDSRKWRETPPEQQSILKPEFLRIEAEKKAQEAALAQEQARLDVQFGPRGAVTRRLRMAYPFMTDAERRREEARVRAAAQENLEDKYK